MIPYEDLLNALVDWRARQGLPPLHNLDYLGELRLNRIDTSSAIAAVTGALEVSDLEEAGAEYDDPLADPPLAAGGDDPWAAANSEYGDAEEMDDPFAGDGAYSADTYDVESYGDAGGFTVDEEIPMDEGDASASATDYQYDDVEAPTSYDVGDSTAMFQELAPAAVAEYPADGSYQQDGHAAADAYNYDPSQYNSPDTVAPSAGQATAMYDTSLASNAAAVEGGALPPPAPNSGAATAMYDTSLASDAAAAIEAESLPPAPNAGAATAMYDTSLASNAAAAAGYNYDGGVPSEPVYDSMAAQAEYQAERLAEQQAHDAGYNANQGYDAGNYGGNRADSQAGGYDYAQGGYAQGGYDQNAYQQQPAAGEPPPLEPPPGGDYEFPFPGDDDEFGNT